MSRATIRPDTVEARLTTADGRPAGFDYMRLCLALAIFAWHCVSITDQPTVRIAQAPLVVGPLMALVPAFFTLSGFLVAGSLVRNPSLVAFGTMRAARIIPALLVDTLFSALVLGPLFTRLPLADYLDACGFYRYFLNVVGHISFTLPGVFENNPSNFVNSQLWTIPWELYSYAALFLLALFGLFRRRGVLLAIAIAANLWVSADVIVHGGGRFVGNALVPGFLAGACAFQYRNVLPVRHWALLPAGLIVLLCWPVRWLLPLLPWAIVYLVVTLGVTNPRRTILLRSGDYSYGIYLYSLPITQALIAAVPFARSWWGSLLLATPTVLLFAALSWHGVEKHALKRREPMIRFAARWFGRGGRIVAAPEPQEGA